VAHALVRAGSRLSTPRRHEWRRLESPHSIRGSVGHFGPRGVGHPLAPAIGVEMRPSVYQHSVLAQLARWPLRTATKAPGPKFHD